MSPPPPRSASEGAAKVGQLLGNLRRARGISGHELARHTGLSQSKVSRIETGSARPSVHEIEAIAKVLGLQPGESQALLKMTEEAYVGVRDWRTAGTAFGVQDKVGNYEQTATTVRILQTAIIPGLLQTPDYTRALLIAYLEFPNSEFLNIAAVVAKRMERQKILRDEGKTIWIVLLESILYFQLCPPSVMLTQIEALREYSRLENVKIRIVRQMSKLPIPVPHPVEIFDDTAYTIDLTNTAVFTDGASEVQFYIKVFEAYFEAGTEDIDPILDKAYKRFSRHLPGPWSNG